MKTQASTTLTRGQSGLLHRAARWVAVVSLLVVVALPALAHVRHNDSWARQQFTKAERMREALNGRPAAERTRRDHQRVLDAYRRVYFGSPASSKADPSVVATAELMVEMGRRFNDNKILRGAVDEYRFLRKEYPGSKYRFDALFTIGEIYKDDLNDSQEARTTFEDFLHRYPRNRLAEEARAAVKEIDDATAEAERTARKGRTTEARATEGRERHPVEHGKETARADSGVALNGRTTASANASNSTSSEASNSAPGPSNASSKPASDSPSDDASDASSDTSANTALDRRNELPRVTGVRHWSTPNYTRVAIDVEQEVKFYSSRIANPDRIFFDLRDTRLASTLVGKTFDVDDGFLKKIRVAEFKPGRTRIVLEVDDLSSYDAFLLPDPYRLIIDVHGKQSRASLLANAHGAGTASDTATSGTMFAGGTAADADDDASDTVAERKGQIKSEKEHAIVAKAEKGTDSDDEGSASPKKSDKPKVRGTTKSVQPLNRSAGNGGDVIKTTVQVKGSDRRIPKTIVGPDDEETATDARAESVKKRGDTVASVKYADAAAATTGTTADDRASDTASSTMPSPSPSRQKKSRSPVKAAADTADLETREALPTAAGNRSLTRALGLKIGRIVIDAGHGGHDTGTIGPNGLLEKDLVLDVAKRLGRLLEARLGAEVVYTRRDDTFVPLETRTAIANREQADLFISIHANSSHDEDARGVETYYLNFTSSPEALEVAARENAVSEKSIHELQDLVRKIAMKDKIDESREFASDVQDSLYSGLALSGAGVRNRGVKKAPFIVLIGANMPSILAEISFVSNPTDERKLETSEHRQRIAESLYRGVSRYVGGLSGVKVASKIEKNDGQ